MNAASSIAPCWAVLVNAGTLVEEPVPELVCAMRIGTDRAFLRFSDGSTREANL